MMKKLAIWKTLLILLSLSCYALPVLELDPTELNLNFNVGIEKAYHLTLSTPNSTETIYNITFESHSMLEMDKIQLLEPNSSLDYVFYAYSDSPSTQDITLKATYEYYSQTTLEALTYNFTLDGGGFHPTYKQINKGDTIIINNIDSINHTFTTLDYSTDIDILPGQSYSVLMDTVGSYSYFDRVTDYGIDIEVIDNTIQILTHSPEQDRTLRLHLAATIKSTEIEISLFKTNFSIRFNESESNALQLTNIGTETAYNVQLAMNWTAFNINDFNLNVSESRVVLFDIIPLISSSNQSDMTHHLELKITSGNSNSITQPIDVFIPHTSFVSYADTSSTLAAYWREKQVFCDNYPLSPHCISSSIIEYRNVTQWRDKPTNITLTEDEVVDFKAWFSTGESSQIRIENMLKVFLSDMDTRIIDLEEENANMSLQLETLHNISTKNEARIKRDETSSIVSTILFIMIVIIVLIALTTYLVIKVYHRKQADLEG